MGFGCLIGFARICSLGYWGYLAFELSASLDVWYALRAGVEMAVFAALALAGWTKRFKLDIKAVALACACAIASAIMFAVDETGSLGALVAVLAGGSMAVLLYVWMLLLSHFPVRMSVTATVAGLVLAGFIVEGLPFLGYDLALVAVVASAFVAASAAVLLDPGLSSCQPDGPLDKASLSRIPWFTVATFVACEFFASVLYGVSEYMTWLYDWQPNLLVFEVAAVAGIVSTVALVLRSRVWMHVVWVPLFSLLVCAVVFSCLPTREFVQIAVGFMMASVFCANFLMWVVVPALFASLEVPRAFPVGALLILGNSALASLVGDAVGSALPRSMQNLGSVAGLLAIAMAVVFAVAFVASRRQTGVVGVLERAAVPEGKADGTVRRFGAFVRHRKMGFAFNGMTVWDVPDDDADCIGEVFAALPFVSHCYARPRTAPWPYNLYGMVHAKTREELDMHVAEMRGLCGLDCRVLVSSKEYKKSSPVYFR